MIELEKQLAYFQGLTKELTNENKLKEPKIKQLSKNILGRRIRCDHMIDLTGKTDEAASSMKGVCGTVEFVDDACQLHVKWDNGSILVLNPDVDEFTILSEAKDNENR